MGALEGVHDGPVGVPLRVGGVLVGQLEAACATDPQDDRPRLGLKRRSEGKNEGEAGKESFHTGRVISSSQAGGWLYHTA